VLCSVSYAKEVLSLTWSVALSVHVLFGGDVKPCSVLSYPSACEQYYLESYLVKFG